ncbi:hypothetical protein [Cellulomonas cellasea]|uniref:Uncharacterized protein n=1 Tax=Cellulomonas cellasea TaxID=43670 RepID=A0A7W4YD09_9CELL|nr:hypothetical protein [Cellulomonas cellasea]MBB2925570.1 hypothetical protein [Cellulomonas cellasea]
MPHGARTGGPRAGTGTGPGASGLLGLQRTLGNAGVGRLLAAGAGPVVQRDSVFDHIKQAWLAISRGGIDPAVAALGHRSAAERNAAGYVGYGYHLGPGDALRHCSWSALVMGSTIGYELQDRADSLSRVRNTEGVIRAAHLRAQGVLLAHEDIAGGRGAVDSIMDQRNNEVGMGLAVTAYREGVPRYDMTGLSEQRLLAAARASLDGGALTMFDPRTGEMITTGAWRTFRADASTPDPWRHAAAPRRPRAAP